MNNNLNAEGSNPTEAPKYLTISRILVKVIYAWTMFGVIVLSLRVFLLAFSANQSTKFVTFIAETSANFMAPFRGIFPGRPLGATGYFDVSAVFAIIMYLLFAWGLTSLIAYVDFKIAEAKQKTTEMQNNYHLNEVYKETHTVVAQKSDKRK